MHICLLIQVIMKSWNLRAERNCPSVALAAFPVSFILCSPISLPNPFLSLLLYIFSLRCRLQHGYILFLILTVFLTPRDYPKTDPLWGPTLGISTCEWSTCPLQHLLWIKPPAVSTAVLWSLVSDSKMKRFFITETMFLNAKAAQAKASRKAAALLRCKRNGLILPWNLEAVDIEWLHLLKVQIIDSLSWLLRAMNSLLWKALNRHPTHIWIYASISLFLFFNETNRPNFFSSFDQISGEDKFLLKPYSSYYTYSFSPNTESLERDRDRQWEREWEREDVSKIIPFSMANLSLYLQALPYPLSLHLFSAHYSS